MGQEGRATMPDPHAPRLCHLSKPLSLLSNAPKKEAAPGDRTWT